MEDGDRMVLRCEGGRGLSRLVRYPPPAEVPEPGGMYVLVDDGSPEFWWYEWVPDLP